MSAGSLGGGPVARKACRAAREGAAAIATGRVAAATAPTPAPRYGGATGVHMARMTICLAAVALLAASPASAFTRPRKEPDAKPRACPEIGEGYVRIPGSDTCVRVGGLVRVEGATIGTSR